MLERFSSKPDDGLSADPERRERQIAYLDSVEGRLVAEILGARGGPNFDPDASQVLRTDAEREAAPAALMIYTAQ